MRGNNIDGEPIYDDLVCVKCFIELAEESGIGDGLHWHLHLEPEPDFLIYETPSGRVWDPMQHLWVEP